MKKIAFFLLIITLGCNKNKNNPGNTTNTERRGFTINFDGKEFVGIDSVKVLTGYTQYKGISPDKNLVSAILTDDINFEVDITNVPDSGIVKPLCDATCNSANGDAVITYRDGDGNNLTDFSGTVERISSSEIVINASKNGKVLTGWLKWK